MKKLNQKGITHHLLLIGLAVLAVGAISFAGYRVWSNKNDVKAKAAGWTDISSSYNDPGQKIGGSRACYIYLDAGSYGKYYKIRAYAYRTNVYWSGTPLDVKLTSFKTSQGPSNGLFSQAKTTVSNTANSFSKMIEISIPTSGGYTLWAGYTIQLDSTKIPLNILPC